MPNTNPTPIEVAFQNCCPRCGEGKIYKDVLALADNCDACGLDLTQADIGDGPAFFVITIMGALIVALPAAVEWMIGWPLWLHVLVWLPFMGLGSLVMLRFFKSWLLALQYKHHRLGPDSE